jgi:hypothetical protein
MSEYNIESKTTGLDGDKIKNHFDTGIILAFGTDF